MPGFYFGSARCVVLCVIGGNKGYGGGNEGKEMSDWTGRRVELGDEKAAVTTFFFPAATDYRVGAGRS